MNARILNIPSQLIDPFFFPDSKVRVDASHIMPDDPFFSYEILYFNGEATGSLPWVEHELYVGTILKNWEEEGEYLKSLYNKRSKDTLHAMKKSIAQFYMLLYWSNSLPVSLNHEVCLIDQLSIKPVNVVERIAFIRNNPTLFHSFIQLSQLFEEQHKQFAKALALKRARE